MRSRHSNHQADLEVSNSPFLSNKRLPTNACARHEVSSLVVSIKDEFRPSWITLKLIQLVKLVARAKFFNINPQNKRFEESRKHAFLILNSTF